jgi:hypothetical protein
VTPGEEEAGLDISEYDEVGYSALEKVNGTLVTAAGTQPAEAG